MADYREGFRGVGPRGVAPARLGKTATGFCDNFLHSRDGEICFSTAQIKEFPAKVSNPQGGKSTGFSTGNCHLLYFAVVPESLNQEPFNGPFLNGLFSREFPEGNGPLVHSGKWPIEVGKRPINCPSRLMGCVREPHPGWKAAPLKRRIERSMTVDR